MSLSAVVSAGNSADSCWPFRMNRIPTEGVSIGTLPMKSKEFFLGKIDKRVNRPAGSDQPSLKKRRSELG
jgi:hypothetical protein